jgi:hypothetical protein
LGGGPGSWLPALPPNPPPNPHKILGNLFGVLALHEEIENFLNISKKAREFSQEFIRSIVNKLIGSNINELFWVTCIIISRIMRSQDAIELLIKNFFFPEAAIIALTQFELCLDISYIGNDVTRATQWVAHQSDKFHIWKVKDKIIDSEINDKNYKLEIFKALSAIKHGNPLAGGLGFSWRKDGKNIKISNGEIYDEFYHAYGIMLCCLSSYQMLNSLEDAKKAFSIFSPIEDDISDKLSFLLQETKELLKHKTRELNKIGEKTFKRN